MITGIVLNGLGRETRNELKTVKFIERKIVTSVGGKIKIAEIGNGPRSNHELNVVIAHFSFFGIEIFGFELDAGFVGRGYNVSAENKRYNSNNKCRNHIGTKHSFKADSIGKNGNDFGIIGHFRCKKDDSQENEQGTKQVGIVRNKVEVVVKNDFFERGIVCHEFIDSFVDVEHHCNRKNKGNHENKCPQKLFNDIFVYQF